MVNFELNFIIRISFPLQKIELLEPQPMKISREITKINLPRK